LELLPGRDGVGLKTWLRQHPAIAILSRARARAFAQAAAEAAPQAQHVADRLHLLKNIREALERFRDRPTGGIPAAFASAVQTPAPQTPHPAGHPAVPPSPPPDPAAAAPTEPPLAAARQRPPSAKQPSRLERYQEVRRRHAQGQSLQRISCALGLTG